MLKTKVKASSVTHLTDARYFAAWEVEWLGFNLSPGEENSVDPREVAAIREWVDGVQICAELNLPTAADLKAVVEMVQPDLIQVGMLTEIETLREWNGGLPVIKEIVVERDTDLAMIEELLETDHVAVACFLLNFAKGGVSWQDLEDSKPLSLSKLKDWATKYPILLEIELGEQVPSAVLEELPVQGFSVRGGAEEAVGYKSFDDLDDFFEDLEVLI